MMNVVSRTEEKPRAEPDISEALRSAAWQRACDNPVVLRRARTEESQVRVAALMRKHRSGDWEDQLEMQDLNFRALREGGMVATMHTEGTRPPLFALTFFAAGAVSIRTRTLVGTESDLDSLTKFIRDREGFPTPAAGAGV